MIAQVAIRFNARFRVYSAAHRTAGCKIMHLIGIPMIALSVIWLFIDWRMSVVLFVVGWILQFIGHYVFEHNSPLILAKNDPLLTVASALLFIAKEWFYVLSGQGLKNPDQTLPDSTNNKT